MLAIASFAVPFARSTLALGVGGPTRAPDGPLLPLKHALDLFGGGGGAALGALGLLLLALAWHANPGPSSPRRASAAVISGLAMLALGGMVTAMRARYVLPVFPLLVVACAAATRAAAAARTRSSLAPHLSVGAITLCTLLFVGHAWLLPCTFRQSCAASEIARGVPLSATLGMLSAHPRAPVVVVPSWSIAEPCYRLIHKFPGPDSRRDCPARLCVENEQRAMFGLDASDFPEHFAKLQTQLGRVFVLLRGPEVAGLEACDLDAQEEGARLYRCEAREK
jgi:hypothetical protein